MTSETKWWAEFFPDFRPLFGIKQQKTTNAEVRYLMKKLNLKPGSSFLDCPCGIGRISLPLAKAGVKVTGIDITATYLDELQTKAMRRGLRIVSHLKDMRRIDFENRFHAAGNLWTSIGYFEKEADNLLAIKRMFKALRPGGRFVLHTINRDWIVKNFAPSDWSEVGSIRILETRDFDLASSRSRSTWRFLRDGEEKVYDVYIRMYSFHEVLAMLKAVGFVDIEGYGSLKDDPVTFDSRMMWVFGTRPRTRR